MTPLEDRMASLLDAISHLLEARKYAAWGIVSEANLPSLFDAKEEIGLARKALERPAS